MITAKSAAAWLGTQLRKELTIQKPTPEQMKSARPQGRQETSDDIILKRGLGGFAMLGLIVLVMAALVL